MSGIEADEEMVFRVLKNVATTEVGPRLGRLVLPRRKPMDTPDFYGLTSRGVVPHVTSDNIIKHTSLHGTYLALEDFIETSIRKPEPAIFHTSNSQRDPLHTLTAIPSHVAMIFGARRHTAIVAPMGNGNDYISVFTSTGFKKLTLESYNEAIESLRPDIAIPLADLTFASKEIVPATKRQVRMVERTEDWLAELFGSRTTEDADPDQDSTSSIFAPLLPVDYATQWSYLNRLSEDFCDQLSGLAIYDVDVLPHIENYKALTRLPRLSMDATHSPHQVLRQIQLGVDIFTLPFVNTSSDSGVALTFSFAAPSNIDQGIMPLGVDMWSPNHQVALTPLMEGCTCYTCTKHHRAYVHHLLNAREMLGWTLLQLHNYQVVSDFFASIRKSLDLGLSQFEEQCGIFSRVYDPDIPMGTGERPRARGYHLKTSAGQAKINPAPWVKYETGGVDDPTLAAETAGLAATGASAQGKETPIVPEADAVELDRKGFADLA